MEYIYTLTDPRDNKIRYVGKTNDITARLKVHIANKANCTEAKKLWVDELTKLGLSPILNVIDTVSDNSRVNAFQVELAYIHIYTNKNCELFNKELQPRKFKNMPDYVSDLTELRLKALLAKKIKQTHNIPRYTESNILSECIRIYAQRRGISLDKQQEGE